MSKFKQGDKLFLHEDNSEVTVVSIYPQKPKQEPVYLVRSTETGGEFNEREMFLYRSNKIFPNARYRVEEEVFFHSQQKKVKPEWYEIIDIFIDKDISDKILYKCRNEKNEIRDFTHYNIFPYDFAIHTRQ